MNQAYTFARIDPHSYSTIAIGYNANDVENKHVTFGGINISELEEKVKSMETNIEELQEIIKKQNEMLISLWYYPGMPGANEAKEQYDKDANVL